MRGGGFVLAVMSRVVVAVMLLCACKPAPVGATFEQFRSPVGAMVEPECRLENDGKRYALEGFLQLGESVTIDEHDQVDLELAANADGADRPVTITVKNGSDIDDLRSQFQNEKGAGYRRSQGELRSDALRIHATNGTATASDRVRVVFEQKVLTAFQSKDVSACVHRFVEATRQPAAR